jgi:hypothetical protein
MGARVAQANPKISANGIELMDSATKTLQAALEAIQDMATNALSQIRRSQEQHSMRWKCKTCQYIKHLRSLSPWKAQADARDAGAQSSNLFCDVGYAFDFLKNSIDTLSSRSAGSRPR